MRHRAEYLAVKALRWLVRVLPHAAVRSMGAALGLMFYGLDRVHRRVAATNLATAFPKRSAAERRQITRAMFVHFGRLLFELLRFSTLTPQEMRRRMEFDGEERARAAYAQGKGVLFFTGHFGYWEIQAIGHGLEVQPVGVLARALDNPYLNALLESVRGSTGNWVIYRHGAVRKVLRALSSGQGVALLIDQHMHSADAIYVDFFERSAATTSMLAALALRTGAPVVPVFALAARPRPLSSDLRASCRAPGSRLARRDSRVHPALHRRARDVRAPASVAVALDAPALARRAAARGDAGDVSSRAA